MDFRTGKNYYFINNEKYLIVQLYPIISFRLENSYKGAKYGREKNKGIYKERYK